MVGKLFRVIFSRRSLRQLKDISDYVSRNSSPARGRYVRNAVKAEADKLEKLPESKPILPGSEDYPHTIRYTKKWSYKIIFRVLNPKNIVRILSIRHDAENPEDVLDNVS